MKKLIFFSILIFFSYTISRTLLVPEEFMNIQQAVVTAQDGDTISLNFGRPNGESPAVSSQQIMGRAITFEVRGEGKERLFKMIKVANNQPATYDSNPRFPGWSEPRMVNRPDSTTDHIVSLAVNNLSRPWVVWCDGIDPYELSCTKWNGSSWDEEMGIFVYDSTEARLKPRITFDGQNKLWLIYHKAHGPNRSLDDIFYTVWNGISWDPERQVNLPDSTEVDYSPRIGYGNGQIWCCWYGAESPYLNHRYKVFVSRWNGSSWESEDTISPPDTWDNWFCDIVVDSLGLPHVVWGATLPFPPYRSGRVCYCTYDGERWLETEIINNPQQIAAAGWPATAISLDSQGNVHVVWVGLRVGEEDWEIFYSKKENNIWSEPVQINIPDAYDDWYPCIAAKEPDDIWISWYKEISFWETFNYVSHFDGFSWAPEGRLDNRTIIYSNGITELAFGNNETWAVWDARTVGVDRCDIYYSRYQVSPVVEKEAQRTNILNLIILPNPFNKEISISFSKITKGHTFLAIYDLKGRFIKTLINQEKAIGSYTAFWDGKGINDKETPEGVYFALLKLGGREAIKKIIKIK